MLQHIAATKGTAPNPPSLNERLNSGSQIPNNLFPSESADSPRKTILSYWQDKVDRMPKIEFGAPATTAVGVKIPGATFVKRIIVHLDNILIREQPARHEGHIDQTNVKNIIASFNRKGFDPTLTESGQGLIVMRLDKNGLVGHGQDRDKEFELKGGFHRYAAQDKIRKDEGTPDNKWVYAIVDVYEYETPLAQALHAGGTNCHVNTNKPANKNDICVQVSYNVAKNILGANLKDITAFVEIVGCHMSEKARKSVVQTAMSRLDVSTAGGRVRSLIPEHDITNPGHVVHYQVKFDLPYRGKGNGPQVTNSSGDLATYISDEGGSDKALTLGLGWWAAAGYPTDRFILVGLYINTADLLELHNNPRALQVLRKKWRKKFDTSLEVWIQERIHWDRMLLDEVGGTMTDKELEARGRAKCPVRFVGFFPQHESPSSIKGGLPTETTMVDENGDPFDYKILLGRK